MAGDVLALMGHLDLERASIVGHSLGGKVAQEVALLAPARVDKLVLVCSSAQHDVQSRSLMELWISLREEIADDLVFARGDLSLRHGSGTAGTGLRFAMPRKCG